MAKNIFKESKKFYSIDYSNGKEVKNNINIKFIDKNKAIINDKTYGEVKILGPNSNKFVCYEIASLFDIDVAKTYRLINEDNIEAIFITEDVFDNELFISMELVYNKVFEKYSENKIDGNNWISKALKLPKNSILNNELDIKILIDTSINVVRDSFKLSDEDLEIFKYKYIQMIFFDYIISNNSRNTDEYNLIINNKTKSARLSPIGNNFIVRDIDEYQFNNKKVDRLSLIKVIYNYYYEYIKKISMTLNEHYITYIETIRSICRYNLKTEYRSKIEKIISSNFKIIEELENNISKNVEKTNKIEHTQTSIRINQDAMQNNLLYMSKYPIDIIKDEVLEDDDNVKIIYEEKKSNFKIILFVVFIVVIIGISIYIMLQ